LNPGQRHKFSVVAFNAENKSTFADSRGREITTTTNATASTQRYLAPRGIKATSTSLNSITITWNASTTRTPDGVETYKIELWNANNRVMILTANSPDIEIDHARRTAVIMDLSPGTRYTVRVTAVASDGTESQTGRGRIATERFTAVTGLRSTIGVDVVTLSWNATKFSEVTGYEVVWLNGRSESPVEAIPGATLIIDAANATATITCLEGPNRYTFIVRALYHDGINEHKSLNARITVRLR